MATIEKKYAPNLKNVYLLRIVSPWNLALAILAFVIIANKIAALWVAVIFLALTAAFNLRELHKTYREVAFTTKAVSITCGLKNKETMNLNYSDIQYMDATRYGWGGSVGYDSLDLYVTKQYDEPVRIYRGYFKPDDFMAIKETLERHVKSHVDDWAFKKKDKLLA